MYEKLTKVLNVLFTAMFITGVVMCLVSSSLYTDNNADYTVLQPELQTPDPIDCVLVDSKSGMIYVCYSESSAVNVYDGESGEFLWAVSVPYLRHSYFDLDADRLYIYGANEAYLYDSKTGAFLEKGESDAYGLSFDLEEDTAIQGDPVPGEVYYDIYNVYKVNPDGSRQMIACAPWWVDCFNIFIWWLVGFSGGLGKGALILLDKVRQGARAKRAAQADFSGECELIDKVAAFTVHFYRSESVVNILLAVIFVLFTSSVPKVTLLLFPVTIVFIIAQIVLVNLLDRRKLSAYEKQTVSMWNAINWGTYIAAFLTLAVIMILNGGEIQL
ncbi:MAG: hypothetical protein ACI4SB_10100 [Acutalibacteraceae bacterium]